MRSSKKRPATSNRFARALAICGLVLVSAPPLAADGPPEEAEAPAAAGWRAYLDPETGELTATPSREQIEGLSEEIRSKELRQALSRSSAGLEPFALARGGRGVFLDGRFQSALVVRRHADGSFALVCADDAEQAGEAVAEPLSTEPPADPQWVEK